MDIQEQLETLSAFIRVLPLNAQDELSRKELDIVYGVESIASKHDFVMRETGNICEGVKRVLAGEDSASNFLAFIQKDPHIEEDNRPKLPALAYEIQQKVFDPVLPILKQAGFPIKEGRVPAPPPQTTPTSSTVTTAARNIEYQIPNIEKARIPNTEQEKPPMEERNIRALTRIAAGTKYSEQELRNAFEDLPPGLRQSLSSVDTANAIESVAKRHLLHVDQMASLASESGLVLLGLTHPADFVANIARRLRLPEDQAKEIARDVSAEIFVRVRDSLRMLHEDVKPHKENIEPRIPNIEKAQNSNIQNIKQSQPPASASSPSDLKAISYKPKAGLQTPYSPGAKWNTGAVQSSKLEVESFGKNAPAEENILARQARMKESLNREEVLRGIENPRQTYEYTNYANQRMNTNRRETPQDDSQLTAHRYPPQGGLNASQKMRPQSEGIALPPKPKVDTDDFLDQKLQTPVTMPREEKRYTVDPYREPLG